MELKTAKQIIKEALNTTFLNLSGSNPLPTSGEFSCDGTIAFSSSGNFFFRSASAWCKLNL